MVDIHINNQNCIKGITKVKKRLAIWLLTNILTKKFFIIITLFFLQNKLHKNKDKQRVSNKNKNTNGTNIE